MHTQMKLGQLQAAANEATQRARELGLAVSRKVVIMEDLAACTHTHTLSLSLAPHPHRVSTLGVFARRCLTCGLPANCSFLDASLSPDRRLAILNCKGPSLRSEKLFLLSINAAQNYFITKMLLYIFFKIKLDEIEMCDCKL